jgi:hypothetical protein
MPQFEMQAKGPPSKGPTWVKVPNKKVLALQYTIILQYCNVLQYTYDVP